MVKTYVWPLMIMAVAVMVMTAVGRMVVTQGLMGEEVTTIDADDRHCVDDAGVDETGEDEDADARTGTEMGRRVTEGVVMLARLWAEGITILMALMRSVLMRMSAS